MSAVTEARARLCEVARSITDGDHQAPPKSDEGVPFLTIAAINDGTLRIDNATRYVPESYFASLKPERKPKVGDILYSVTGSIGIPAIVDDPRPFTFQRHIAIIKPDPEIIDSRYLLHALRTDEIKEQALSVATGTAQLTIPLGGLRNLELTVPPVPEQRRIVAKLDNLRARSARARQELDHIPKLIERYKQAILAKAFCGELTADWRSRRGVASVSFDGAGIDGRMAGDLPDLPHSWSWTSVARVTAVKGGLTKNAKRGAILEKAKYLRVANVYANELRLDDIAEIGCSASDLEKTRLVQGDLLIVEGNGSLDQIGRVALWNAEIADCSHQNHIIRARPLPSVLPKYGLYWLLSPIGRTAIERVASSSSGLHTLSISKVSALPIPMCDGREQIEIVRRIEHAFAWLDKIATEHSRAEHLLPKLDQAILAKAFRGALVPQDPNDEPASVLLERIKGEREDGEQPKRRRARM